MAITTLHRISEIQGIEAGFTTTNNSRWTREKLIELLNEGRAVAITNFLQSGSQVHASWLQKITIPYSALEQPDSCYTTFPFPYSVIKAKKTNDGCYFVGNDKFTSQYDRVNTRGEFLNMQKHPILARAYTQGVAALFEDGNFELYSNQSAVHSLGVSAIFNQPTKLPYFNLELDNYPIDNNTMEFCIGYIKEKYANQIEATPIQTPNTSKDQSQFSISQRRR